MPQRTGDRAVATNDADLLRSFRQSMGLTQAKAAKLTKTPQRTWEGYESEDRKVPANLLELCRYIQRFGPIDEPNMQENDFKSWLLTTEDRLPDEFEPPV